jgi:hypothetical protein
MDSQSVLSFIILIALLYVIVEYMIYGRYETKYVNDILEYKQSEEFNEEELLELDAIRQKHSSEKMKVTIVRAVILTIGVFMIHGYIFSRTPLEPDDRKTNLLGVQPLW